MTPGDPTPADATDRLSLQLRAWLREHARGGAVEIQAGALVYELAALIAREAPTEARAYMLVDRWAAVMKTQIALFGVGVDHP